MRRSGKGPLLILTRLFRMVVTGGPNLSTSRARVHAEVASLLAATGCVPRKRTQTASRCALHSHQKVQTQAQHSATTIGDGCSCGWRRLKQSGRSRTKEPLVRCLRSTRCQQRRLQYMLRVSTNMSWQPEPLVPLALQAFESFHTMRTPAPHVPQM